MHPLVSVIVPVFNVEDFLVQCVDSVLAQTHDRLQVILINDGSTDQSPALCNAYLSDPRVEVINKPNGGLSSARNAGLERARGQYLTFVDSDDWIAPDFIECSLRLLSMHRAGIAVGRLHRTKGSGDSELVGSDTTLVLPRSSALFQLNRALHTRLTVSCAKVYESALFQGLRFPIGRLHEDEFTTYLTIARTDRVVLSDRPTYFYRSRPGSITQSEPTLQHWLDALDAYRQRLRFFEDAPLSDVADVARVELVRKLLHLRHWNSRSRQLEPAAGVKELRALSVQIQNSSVPRSIKLLCQAHSLAPWLVEPLHRAYLALRAHSPRQPRSAAKPSQ